MAREKNMWLWINETVQQFEKNFSRRTTFCWFAIILLGLMIRSDHLGITSIVRELSLAAGAYPAMLHFFRSEGWHVEGLKYTWLKIIATTALPFKEAGRYILIGDGVKCAKEGRKMPGVKKLHQESDNSSKVNTYTVIFMVDWVYLQATERSCTASCCR